MKTLCRTLLLMGAIGALGVGAVAARGHGIGPSHDGNATGAIRRKLVTAGASAPRSGNQSLLPTLAIIGTGAPAAAAVCFYVGSRRSRNRERRREELYRNLFHSSRDPIVIADRDRCIIDVNQPALRDTFGYETAELVGCGTHCLYATEGEFQRAGRELYNRQGAEEEATLEVRFRTKHGETFPGTLRALRLRNRKGEVVGNIGIIHDITEEKRQEAQLADSQDRLEKSYLRSQWLAEVGRQVLGGQEMDEIATVVQAREAFRTSRHRIHSMAQVHESLYQSPELSHVDMEEYFDRFLPQLLHAYDKAGHVEIRTIVDQLELPVTEAVPCGIIVNELVSNALKHAFPDRRGGSILVRLQRAESNRVVLSVEDDGVGLVESPDLQGGRTLGLNLTSLLAEQLGGTFDYADGERTRFCVTFKPGA